MKKRTRNLAVTVCLFVFCLALSIVLNFANQNALKDTPTRKINYGNVSANAVSVMDVKGVMKMTAFNYLPNEFAELDEIVSDENDGGEPARRGTYRFYIDTLTLEEWADSDSLDHLLETDGNRHLTMYIPPEYSACSVFVQYQNKEYLGSIDRYNIEYYTNFSSAKCLSTIPSRTRPRRNRCSSTSPSLRTASISKNASSRYITNRTTKTLWGFRARS